MVRPNQGFGRTRGSAGPPVAPLASSFEAGAGMIANGILEMCSASWSTSMAASARFAGKGSPSTANVDEASLKGTIALPAMGMIRVCGEDESKRIKVEVREKGEGEDHFKAKTERKLPFCSPAHMEMRSGH